MIPEAKKFVQTFRLLTIFSIAMGFMESAIVVYLRIIYYPDGFKFPLVPIHDNLGYIELLREISTIVMLLTIGLIAGKTKVQRFSFFIFCFAVWDIFYYIFLKLLIDWPLSLFDWDILFLIPAPWIGPVLAPCILSLTMIVFAITLTFTEKNSTAFAIKFSDWLLLSAGSVLVIISFIFDYLQIAFFSERPSTSKQMLSEMNNFVPQHFNWWIFFIGESIFFITLINILKRHNVFKKYCFSGKPFLKRIHKS